MTAAIERFSLRHVENTAADFATDVKAGLSAARKAIPPRWFYDELGSVLFDAICLLPEYYVTRSEAEIFAVHSEEIASALRSPARIIELGSGTARKTRLLLERLRNCEYVPVDIDCAMVEKTGRRIADEMPAVRVSAVCGDFTEPAAILHAIGPADGRTVVLFLGSTIGNLDHEAATTMLRDIRASFNPGDQFLLGADLRKEHAILHAAYNDALGVTAAFNLNLLQRINRELGGHFDLDSFRHRAVYSEEAGRIEMYLDSTRNQTVAIDALGMSVAFAEAEPIHTENSYKYSLDRIATLAASSGFGVARTWSDARGWFADVLLVAE